MENTVSNIGKNISLLPSLLKAFEMFQMRLLYYGHNEEENVVEVIPIRCRNCHTSTGLYLKDEK